MTQVSKSFTRKSARLAEKLNKTTRPAKAKKYSK
jgi:hypothetical protein